MKTFEVYTYRETSRQWELWTHLEARDRWHAEFLVMGETSPPDRFFVVPEGETVSLEEIMS